MARKKKPPAPVEAVVHKDTRSNIPTREQGGLVPAGDAAPLLYPRDPSLDPQLVWKGKDTQDAAPLEVPAVPIYIQEKIQPQAIIEGLRSGEGPVQLEMFPGLGKDADPGKRTEFYRHGQGWSNRLILGDSLLVMGSLAAKEGLKGRVQMVYFDPPYGIKFGSNWQVSTRRREVKDAKAADLTRQPEQVKAFRDTWELGVHSYLSYLRDRLVAARDLLTESGSCFVQIGDENVHLVRCLMDEVFGSENSVSLITCAKTTTTTGRLLPGTNDFLIWYARDIARVKYRDLFHVKQVGGAGAGQYNRVELVDGTRRVISGQEQANLETLPPGSRIYRLDNLTSPRVREARTGYYPITFKGRDYLPTAGEWKTSRDGMARLAHPKRIDATSGGLYYVRYIDDFPAFPINNSWADTGVSGFASERFYVVQTATKIIERCMLMTTDPGDLVLDPTCGSGTTAAVAEQCGRRWITTDTSRVALALARTRLMSAKFPYYHLLDTPEGRAKEADVFGLKPAPGPTEGDIRKGFVYRRVPHVTLKSIANNPDIKEGMARQQIDEAIRRHAESETLFDKPYEDTSAVRVAGPFTVESLSPHRVLPTGERPKAAPAGTGEGFVPMILDHLRKAGVQNTRKDERLVFDRLDPYPGESIHAQGSYDEAGTSKRVAVCIGPEFGTVGQELLSSAAQEASRGVPFDLLLVCGFAFDPHAAEEGRVVEKQMGRLRVLLVRMNPDLAMGDEVLKNTGAGNLFLVFGEPDVGLEPQPDGKLVVEVRGVDVYDPTSGEVRSAGPDEIACWFIDTDYDGESFFVRHAYFLGGQELYEKLKRALKADIDEEAWSALYGPRSRPFDPPMRGKVAVKIINHYGDEVLKVYTVPVGKPRK